MPLPELDDKYTRLLLLSYFVNCTRCHLDASVAPPPSPCHYKALLAPGAPPNQLLLSLNQEEAALQALVDQIQAHSHSERVQLDEEIERLTAEADHLKLVAAEGVHRLARLTRLQTTYQSQLPVEAKVKKDPLLCARDCVDLMEQSFSRYLCRLFFKKVKNALELKQIAESVKCVLDCREVGPKKVGSGEQFEVLIALDDSFDLPSVWVTEEYFCKLNSHSRSDLLASLAFYEGEIVESYDLQSLARLPASRKQAIREVMASRRLCHHCQKLVPADEAIKCQKAIKQSAGSRKVASADPDREDSPVRLRESLGTLRGRELSAVSETLLQVLPQLQLRRERTLQPLQVLLSRLQEPLLLSPLPATRSAGEGQGAVQGERVCGSRGSLRD